MSGITKLLLEKQVKNLEPTSKVGAEKRDVKGEYVLPAFGSGDIVTSARKSDLQIPAVFSCIRIISEAVGNLRVRVFEDLELESETKAVVRPAYIKRPNPTVNGWFDFVIQLMMSLLTRGNAFFLIERDAKGFILALWPVNPDKCQVFIVGGQKFLKVQGAKDPFTPLEFVHIPALLMPGALLGISPLEMAARAIENADLAQEASTNILRKGNLPSGVLSYPKAVNPNTLEDLRSYWQATYGGAGNTGKVAIVTEGASLQTLQMTNKDSEFLAGRQFQVTEILRIFGTPPHLAADASGSTSWGSGLAEQTTNFVLFTLAGYITRFENAFSNLLSSDGFKSARNLDFKMATDALTHGDYETRIRTYSQAVASNILTADEAREFIDMPPLGASTNG